MLDKRIGKRGAYAPLLCALSNRPVQSGAKGIVLSGDYYVKVNNGRDLPDDLRKELIAIVAPKRKQKESE